MGSPLPSGFNGPGPFSNAEFHVLKFLNRFLKFFPKNQERDKSKIYFIGWFSARILPGNLFWDGLVTNQGTVRICQVRRVPSHVAVM